MTRHDGAAGGPGGARPDGAAGAARPDGATRGWRRRGLLLAGAAAALWRPATARAAVDEGTLLVGLWRREMAAALAYELAGMTTLHQQEADHASALATELAAVGLSTPLEPKTAEDLDIGAQLLAASGSRTDAIALERSLLEAYRAALPALGDAKIAMTVATILGSHAQHLLILRDQAESNALAAR